MRTPFKLLDAYSREDKAAFFGRKQETDALYQMVFKTPMLLIYGLSGTGKTSLIQCGLGNRFDGTDWYPFYIRRGQNLNTSLKKAIEGALPAGESMQNNLSDNVSLLFRHFLRPVYMIFDQFEELFILGSAQEQETFRQDLKQLMELELPCKVIFVMREEFIGQLYTLEKTFPGLYDFRLRVEPMGYKKVSEVIIGSCELFNIQLQDPENNCKQIYDSLSAGKSGIQLPYLQVYLDLLYRQDFQRTYPQGVPNENGKWPQLTFSNQEINQLGKIEDVLSKFLQEQENQIQKTLPANAPDQSVAQFLDVFVTEEGTKKPILYERKSGAILLSDHSGLLLAHFPKEITGKLVETLLASRLLRDMEGSLELAHDSLAHLIDSRRTAGQRRLNELYSRLLNNFKEFQDTKEFLSKRQLNALEEYMPLLEKRLDVEVKHFITRSADHVVELEQKELRQTQEKLKISKRNVRLWTALAILAVLGAVVTVFQANALRLESIKTKKEALKAQISVAQSLKLNGDESGSFAALDKAMAFAEDLGGPISDSVSVLKSSYAQVFEYIHLADSLLGLIVNVAPTAGKHPWALGLEALQSANAVSPDARIQGMMEQANEKIDNEIASLRQFGLTLLAGRKEVEAKQKFELALSLKPDEFIKGKILEINEKLGVQ